MNYKQTSIARTIGEGHNFKVGDLIQYHLTIKELDRIKRARKFMNRCKMEYVVFVLDTPIQMFDAPIEERVKTLSGNHIKLKVFRNAMYLTFPEPGYNGVYVTENLI